MLKILEVILKLQEVGAPGRVSRTAVIVKVQKGIVTTVRIKGKGREGKGNDH
jgi:hypothetical protein